VAAGAIAAVSPVLVAPAPGLGSGAAAGAIQAAPLRVEGAVPAATFSGANA
jgi:hypothetical protein